MSALPPIADINPHRLECLLSANSGHCGGPAVVAGLIKIKEAKLGKRQACTLTHLSAERIGWEILGESGPKADI